MLSLHKANDYAYSCLFLRQKHEQPANNSDLMQTLLTKFFENHYPIIGNKTAFDVIVENNWCYC